MSDVINKNLFLVKEHVGFFKAANNYDIHDPETNQIVMTCREPTLGFFTKLMRFSDWKTMSPFDVHVNTADGAPVVRVSRGFTFFLSKVHVFDPQGTVIGSFKQKFFSIGGKFDVLDPNEQVVCSLKGDWKGWDFRFIAPGEQELARVTKKWAGLGKELFTTADNYMLSISPFVPPDSALRRLIFAAVMCIDMVLKEK